MRHAQENDLSIDISKFPSADESGASQVMILAGDPSAQSMFNLDTVPEFKEKRGHIRVAMVRGSGHDMHKEASQIVADVASGKALDEIQGLEVRL